MILFLKPYFDKKPWAGNDINKLYRCGKDVGEAWLISAMPGQSSIIKGGAFDGMELSEFWKYHAVKYGFIADYQFPLLVKLISSKDKLSVQVHPNDRYANENYGKFCKFECWYILKANEGKITVGTNCETLEELQQAIDQNKVEDYLNECSVKKGDLVVIKPGTIHAIHKDTFVLEVQEPSDITYRLYDYNREPKRELHIKEAMDVINIDREEKIYHFDKTKHFLSNHFNLKKKVIKNFAVLKDIKGKAFIVLSGRGKVNNQEVKPYDSFIVDRNEKCLFIFGKIELLIVDSKTRRMKQ